MFPWGNKNMSWSIYNCGHTVYLWQHTVLPSLRILTSQTISTRIQFLTGQGCFKAHFHVKLDIILWLPSSADPSLVIVVTKDGSGYPNIVKVMEKNREVHLIIGLSENIYFAIIFGTCK